VTFIDNPDTDTSKGQQIISNKLLAYAFLLTIEGYPFVYGKDYFDNKVWLGAYGLHKWIDRLVMIHEHIANGGTVTRYLDDKVIVLNRIGSPGLLTAINFDTWNKRTITCDTSFPPNTHLHDYTARHPDIQTDPSGRVTFTIPSNEYNNGQSYLCFSRPGIDLTSHVSAKTTTQTIFGTWDLDVKPALNQTEEIGKIEIKEGTNLEAQITVDRNGWPANAEAILTVIGPNNHQILNQRCVDHLTRATTLESKGGTHTIEISGKLLPENGSSFEVTLTYMAPHS
jgi:alpha-amylase